MRYLCINIDGGLGRLDRIKWVEKVMLDHDLSVICIIESAVPKESNPPNILDSIYDCSYFNAHRIVVYHKKSFAFTVTKVDTGIPNIVLHGRELTLGFIYSEFRDLTVPNSIKYTDNKRMDLLINTFSAINNSSLKKVIICGDMNANILRPEAWCRRYTEAVAEMEFSQIIEQPTRLIRGNMIDNTLIDHIWKKKH